MSAHYKEIKNGKGTDLIIGEREYISIGRKGEDVVIGNKNWHIAFDSFDDFVNAIDVSKARYARKYD